MQASFFIRILFWFFFPDKPHMNLCLLLVSKQNHSCYNYNTKFYIIISWWVKVLWKTPENRLQTFIVSMFGAPPLINWSANLITRFWWEMDKLNQSVRQQFPLWHKSTSPSYHPDTFSPLKLPGFNNSLNQASFLFVTKKERKYITHEILWQKIALLP